MYINTTYQSIIQELLFFISQYYEEVKLLALNNGGTLNYLYLRDFSGIEGSQLNKLRNNLTDLINELPSLVRHLIVDKTSSDSNIFFADDILWLIDPIKKLLIEIDLSESTLIDFM